MSRDGSRAKAQGQHARRMRTPLFTQAQLSPNHSVFTRFGPSGAPFSGTRSIEKRPSFEATSQMLVGVTLYPTDSTDLTARLASPYEQVFILASRAAKGSYARIKNQSYERL